ncbi:hypothetical protein HHI36_000348 [Cryptolaemus montrouzieri]|uniref:Bromodomain adjacent to zinc finger domain protein 1A n=1 Tax=Cryptolaemus montrouzieri TaxID=559131 RepID=A0ABD2P4E1_9CUCU
MPLLKKGSFEKASAPEFLRDDEEVFYCEITNEIFRNYEEFAERMLLCTSMVWTCSMTGKSNLTYEEALESEENARRSIREFPVELRIPILYVASRTKRTGFGELADDVFMYCKDRYFIGEKVETSFTGNKWVDSHVLQVLAPSADELKKGPKNGSTDKNSNPSALLYKYEIEHLDADDEDISEIMIVDFNQIRRKKALFSKEKCKLFLKQYVEQDPKMPWTVKASAMKDFGITNMKFDKIFNGPEPNFDSPKKLDKKVESKKAATVNGKKSRQETLAKYLTKVNGTDANNGTVKNNGSVKKNSELLEQMEKRKVEFAKMKQLKDEEFAKMKQQKEEEKKEQRLKQKQDSIEISNQLKEWNKPKEDLELEDQMIIPSFSVVKCKIPNKYMGDILMIMEFIKSFEKLLKAKNFFQSGVTIDMMERALLEEEVAGPLVDLLHMLLSAIFRLQDEESQEYSTQLAKATFLDKIDIKNMSLEEAAKFATLAAGWPKARQGLFLRNLPIDSLTVSEVLRIHLLSSGAKFQEAGERGRFGQRGGYCCTDDPGLFLRLYKPQILKSLAVKNVGQLKIKEKVAILTCLMEQLLTYADFRDTIEDRIEKNRQARVELKNVQATVRKRENEHSAAIWHLKKDAKMKKQDPEVTAKVVAEFKEASEKRKQMSERQLETHYKNAFDKELLLGMDRAFRRYYKLESLPGVFVDGTEDHPGACLQEPVKQIPALVNAERSAIIAYFRKNLNKVSGSDKENSPTKKSASKVNGDVMVDGADSCSKLLVCSADEKTCPVHSENRERHKWEFLPHAELLDNLSGSLNKRGVREGELLQNLKNDKDTLTRFIKQTPVQNLNPDLDIIIDEDAKPRVATRGKKNYIDANFGFPAGTTIEEILQNTLIDDILEMEEKIYSGSLGQLHVKNREIWRSTLAGKDFKNFNREIVRRVYVENEVKAEAEEEEEESTTPELKKKYSSYDPGAFLGPTKTGEDSDEEDYDEAIRQQAENVKQAVECLAIALAQVAQAIEPKFLQKPLGNSSDRNLATYIPSRNRLESWEGSLLNSTSFSQIFLHYSTLDSCIMWNRSTLLAKCKICRRQKDSENMLLCDSCNLGHHLYCLKPKLTSIPKGDWFCDRCMVAKDKEQRKAGGEIIPKKKRRLFKEEEQEEEEEEMEVKQESDEAEEEESEEEKEEEKEESEEEQQSEGEEESSPAAVELCDKCNSGGILISCDDCGTSYHKECVVPPLRRAKPNWVCSNCKEPSKDDTEEVEEHKNNNNDKNSRSKKRDSRKVEEAREGSSDSDDYPLAHHAAAVVISERRSATKARHNIYNFVKSLRRLSSSGDDSNAEEHHIQSQRKRSHRRESGRDDLPLHNAALQDLLTEVMKHPDAWPFLRPVQRNEVPDYHDVITNPMDFGTIKNKLNMGKYNTDSQLMYDVALVFQNCNTYNEADSEIYRCGEKVLEFFRHKCSEIGLKIPSRNQQDEDSNKKRRTK